MADTAALVVALSAQLTKFEKDMQKANGIAQRSVREIEKTFADLNPQAAFGKLAAVLSGGALGAAIVALGHQIRNLVGQLDDIGDSAERIGVSTEVFQAMRFALEDAGGKAEDMDKAMARLSDGISEAALGTTYLTKVFQANGIAIRDQSGEMKSLEELLPSIAQLFAGLSSQSDKVKLSADLFGRQAGPKMIAVMEQLARSSLPAFVQSGKEAGAVIDNELIRKAGELDKEFRAAEAAIGKAFKEVAVTTAPLLVSALNGIVAALQKLKDFSEKANIAAALDNGTASAEQLSKAIELARSKGSPIDPSWIKHLDDLLEKQREFNRAQSFSNRPPPDLALPAPPPKTVLPPTTKDPVESLLQSQQKAIELQKAQTATIGETAGAQERLRVETQLTQGILANDKSPEAYAARIKEIGAAAEEAANRLAKRQFEFNEIISASRELGSALSQAFQGAIIEGQKFDVVLNNLVKRLESKAFDKLFDLAFAPQGAATNSVFGQLLASLTGKMAGGPVHSGQPYVVGEKGPELFVPGQSGMIIPNKVTAQGGKAANQNLNVSVDVTGANGDQAIEDAVNRGVQRAVQQSVSIVNTTAPGRQLRFSQLGT